MRAKIKAGNRIREKTQRADILALLAAGEISSLREPSDGLPQPRPRSACVIVSLKRPEEVDTLRRIYGPGFFLVGIAASMEDRQTHLIRQKRLSEKDCEALIDIDASEDNEWGQRTRDTFCLSDVFVSLREYKTQVQRFLDLAFCCPAITPTQEEHAMFMAYSASLRSGDLSRQVGAALVDPCGDILGVGCNDVPAFGGGLYWPGSRSARDIERKIDANDAEKMDMAAKIMKLIDHEESEHRRRERAREVLRPTGFFDITEFGRAVHAEMEAILACCRTGRSTRKATLYTTTFPCHNCTRHIIAAGIERVVYIEPYAKSKALELHGDAIDNGQEACERRLPFVPFIGVGPRRYFDLFSMNLGTGVPIQRKHDGHLADWNPSLAGPRLQMQPTSYLTREQFASSNMKEIFANFSLGDPNEPKAVD